MILNCSKLVMDYYMKKYWKQFHLQQKHFLHYQLQLSAPSLHDFPHKMLPIIKHEQEKILKVIIETAPKRH